MTASLIGTTLHIVGDAADNSVRLEGRGEGIVEVRGINTTVNGSNKAVNFSNVSSVIVDVADGDDTVRSNGLVLLGISVLAGSGDDTVRLMNTSSVGARLSIIIGGDSSDIGENETNGSDTIFVSGTAFQGEHASFSFQGDHHEGAGGRDQITLANTKLDVASLDSLEVLPDRSSSDPGNMITIENLDITVSNKFNFIQSFIEGGPGDDTFNLRNINVTLLSDFAVFADIGIGTVFGNLKGQDTIDVENVNVKSIVAGGIGEYLLNQTTIGFSADTVRIRNLDATFLDDSGEIFSSVFFQIAASDVEVRNTSVHTNGFGSLEIYNREFYDGVERDDSWTLRNVHVTSANGDYGGLALFAGGGDDQIDITNSSSEVFTADLGEGDDELSLTNVSGNIDDFIYPGIFGGGGNDRVRMVNCTFPELIIDLGEGDDELTLTNNTFVTLAADLGDGDDIATLINNVATHSISMNGGLGIDELTLRHNIALMLLFENFEL